MTRSESRRHRPPRRPSTAPVSKAAIADVEEAMKDVVDPELGINVVDLGLVYGVHVDDENVATLDMTLTSAACPLTDVIEDQTRQALTTGPGGGLVNDIRINWVWLPPWGPDKITDEGRDQLRALGFNVVSRHGQGRCSPRCRRGRGPSARPRPTSAAFATRNRNDSGSMSTLVAATRSGASLNWRLNRSQATSLVSKTRQ